MMSLVLATNETREGTHYLSRCNLHSANINIVEKPIPTVFDLEATGYIDNIHVLLHCYDTVWHDTLKLKLIKQGVNGKMWTILDQMYTSTHASILF